MRRSRIWAARAIALAADAMQIVLIPAIFAGAGFPLDDVLDVMTAIAMTWLLGWHWAFLPAIVTKLIPFVDIVPTWTLAVWVATRGPRHRNVTAP